MAAVSESAGMATPMNATLASQKLHMVTIQDNDPLVGIDAQAPTITVTSPANGLHTTTNVTINGQVTDNFSGLATFRGQLDDAPSSAISVDALGNWSFTTSFPLNASSEGLHTLRLLGTDKAGNVANVPFSFTLDFTAPSA